MHQTHQPHPHPYRRLFFMLLLSFGAMYCLMFAMVNTLSNVQHNLNQIYMAGLMTAPMLLFEVTLMWPMYPNQRLNLGLVAASLVAGLTFFLLIRQQTAIADRQFLRSMIPHHASAILMCERAQLQDPEIKALCASIIANQQAEINQMTAKLGELER